MMRTTRFPARAQDIADRMAGFMAHLRFNGMPAGVAETETALRALAAVDATSVGDVRMALRSICATDADRNRRFDELFDGYWMNAGRIGTGIQRTSNEPVTAFKAASSLFDFKTSAPDGGRLDAPDGEGEDEASRSGEGKLVASTVTNIEKTDLRQLIAPDDLARAQAVAERLARNMRDRRSRRRKAARRGSEPDLRRIARASVSTGGEPLRLYYKKKPDRPVNLVAILDVSGSMTVYARVFLAFLKGLVSADRRTHAYLFHTRLVCISDTLRDGNTFRAIDRLSLMAQGFGGGTRIGENLKRFNAQYARQSVNGRTVVVILSDGYDTDPPELIASALRRLKRRGCRIIWLNPVKGWKDYEPVARGMAAALPYLDLFAAANTLESLAALEPQLCAL